MSEAFPIAFLIVVAAVFASAAVVNHRLLRLFLVRTPSDLIPVALREDGRNPEKVLFFFRASTVLRLKTDPEMWRLRQLLAVLLCAGVALPILFAAVFMMVAFAFSGS
jgi:hypothetical protein